MIKTNLMLTIVILVLDLLVANVFADGSFLATTNWGSWFYRLGNQGTRNGVVYQEIYCTTQLTDAGRAGWGMPKASTVKALYAIDCSGNRFENVNYDVFDSSGNRIGNSTKTEWTWTPIAPGSVASFMREKCCR